MVVLGATDSTFPGLSKNDQSKTSELKIPTKYIELIITSMTAFIFAILLVLIKRAGFNSNGKEWIRAKQAAVIPCDKNGKAGSTGEKNDGCAHQLGASCLLTINSDKRNKPHIC